MYNDIRYAHIIACLRGSEAQRMLFNIEIARVQMSDESIDDFVAQLKQLIIGCRNNPYGGGYEKDMIRDQIADKMRDTSLREKLQIKANELSRKSHCTCMSLQIAIDINVEILTTPAMSHSSVEYSNFSQVIFLD